MIQTYNSDQYIINIIRAGEESDKEWLDYISTHPDTLIYHHPAWLNALESETGNKVIRLTAKDETGKIKGILPLQITSGMFFGLGGLAGSPRVSSLPRTPIAGILADNDNTADELLSAAMQIVTEHENTSLQIKATDLSLYKSKKIRIIPWRENYTINLPEKEEEIKFGNPRNHRRIKWAVNKAGNEGVKIRKADSIDDLKKWYALYLDTSRWHAVPPRSYKFFETLFNAMPQQLMYLLIAEQDNQFIAGSIFLMYNKTVFYSFNGRDKEKLNLRPNDLIQYHAIYDACRKGYAYYDMGEVAGGQDGLVEFKKKWGCETKQIFHIYHFPKGDTETDLMSEIPGNLRMNIWRRIPIGLTAKIGEIINKRL